MYGWIPRRRAERASRREQVAKLLVTPPGKIGKSVRGAEDPEGACAECAAAGIDLTLLDRYQARVAHTHRRINMVVVEVGHRRAGALERALRRLGFAVERPSQVVPMLDQSVPLMAVDQAWRAGSTGASARIGVVDTGVDRSHPDLRGRIAAYQDFTDTGLVDGVGHGTHVCGIAGGAGVRYRGVAPAASLVIAKVLTEEGGDTADVIAGLSWLSSQKVDVINISLGGGGTPDDPLSRECEALTRDGITVCVAAGNEGPDPSTISSPGCAPSVITVGAVDKTDRLSAYSSRGPVRWKRKTISKPDLVAVGGGVDSKAACPYAPGVTSARSTKAGRSACDVIVSRTVRRYVRMSGTSMATPHVTGVVALLVDVARRMGHGIAPGDLKSILQKSSRKLKYKENEQGAGRLDALAALKLLQETINARDAPRRAAARCR
ncbi:MAG: S8 family serine peptidase [Acidobacteria bacterium]|nr:S8 family serine peptidase [Acidobacteriota bacterium]